METPIPLSDSATITRTCATWDGARLALWVEGSGLAQEFTAVGTANLDLFGYVLTIEARAGLRPVPFGGWEGFFQLTRPVALGPITVPLQVADDGTRVALWLSTTGLGARSSALRAETASSFSLTFTGADGTPQGSVVVPLSLSPVVAPTPPAPDIHPSTPAAGAHAPPAVTTSATEGAASRQHGAGSASSTATRASGGRVSTVRAMLGRY